MYIHVHIYNNAYISLKMYIHVAFLMDVRVQRLLCGQFSFGALGVRMGFKCTYNMVLM